MRRIGKASGLVILLLSFVSGLAVAGGCDHGGDLIPQGQVIEINGTEYECLEVGLSPEGERVFNLEIAGYVEYKFDEFELSEMGVSGKSNISAE